MNFGFELSDVLNWIEHHGQTVDLIKWLLLIAVAWVVGLFKFLRRRLKSPTLEIETLTSRAYCHDLGEQDGHQHVCRSLFLLSVGVNNPTTDTIVVRDLTLRYKEHRPFRWTPWQHPTTLPARPRQAVGGTVKLLRNWFSNFAEGPESLTVGGRIEPRAFESGYLLFVAATYGWMNPRVHSDTVHVQVQARLTTGEKLKAKARVQLFTDPEAMDTMVPGVGSYAANSSTWNISTQRRT
jgi:hypothetical protein